MHPQTADFFSLFVGYNRAYGTYQVPAAKPAPGMKVQGKAATLFKEVTSNHYSDHLLGKSRLGIIPITDQSAVKFGAIDVDSYNLNHSELVGQVVRYKLPLVVCRSKSGGAHIYLFLKEFIAAQVVQEKLKEFAALLGLGTCEIFPKQTQIIVDRGDIGSWINLPYFDADKTLVNAFDDESRVLNVVQFVKFATNRAVTLSQLQGIDHAPTESLTGGPPCLQRLIVSGFGSGTRNNGLFNLGVYAKKAYPDTWKQQLENFNKLHMKPPLTAVELVAVMKSLDRKEYQYTCKQAPISAYCDKQRCRRCKHGVGIDDGMPKLGTLTKVCTVPPVWFLEVEGGGRIELTTDDLQNPRGFQKRCMEVTNIMPNLLKREDWEEIVQELLEHVTLVEMPEEASPKGTLFEHLREFCTSRSQAKTPEEMYLGKPFLYNGHHWFRVKDFMAYLERQRFKVFSQTQISAYLQERHAEKKFWNIRGRGINVIGVKEYVPDPELPTPEIAAPEL